MTMEDIISEIKLEITGGVLKLELTDDKIEDIVKKEMRELERYWDETKFVTIPFASCIDLNGSDFSDKANAVVKIYRTEGYGEGSSGSAGLADPMFAQQWMLFSNGGTMYNLNDYMLNYGAWMTMMQVKNTMSTDLAFREDAHAKKLYINHYLDVPNMITIEYIPKLKNVEDIKQDYWIDMLIKLSVAMTKVIEGRIKTRFVLSNGLYSDDGEKMLEEGNTELEKLREVLRTNDNLIFGVD